MNTMEAFGRAQVARASGAKERQFDYKKAIERINAVKPQRAELYLAEDREWVSETVYEDGKFTMNLNERPPISGIHGSIWATPMLDMDGEEEECWVRENSQQGVENMKKKKQTDICKGIISEKELGEFLSKKTGHLCKAITQIPFSSDFIFVTEKQRKKR